MRKDSPYLKAHMRSGYVYVMSNWDIPPDRTVVTGSALLYDPYRNKVTPEDRPVTVGLDSVLVLETNRQVTSGTSAPLIVMGVISLAVSALCAANPKECFGSCPTFYAAGGDGQSLRAEGFSASIAPSLEATDTDALGVNAQPGETFRLEMRNEALETHVVRRADIMAVPHSSATRVYASTDSRYWITTPPRPPQTAIGPEGDCLGLLAGADGKERFSLADSNYLATKETVELSFDAGAAGSPALVISCRQTLLSTYLLYQAFAYMGRDAGYWLAALERGDLPVESNRMAELLGGVEVLVETSPGEWRNVETIDEQGPLAVDTHLVPLDGVSDGPVNVKLRMSKGHWRLDAVALVDRLERARAIRVPPGRATRDGIADDDALAALVDPERALTTMPGDTYVLEYALPTGHDEIELFLESRGYYFEWIRDEWLEEENPQLLAEMMLDPEGALERHAPAYKRVEAFMEETFWSSRYARP